jgi:hypothetical protein
MPNIAGSGAGCDAKSAGTGPRSEIALDPGDDGDAELVTAGPVGLVQDVALQEREQRLRCRVVTGRADRPIEPTMR